MTGQLGTIKVRLLTHLHVGHRIAWGREAKLTGHLLQVEPHPIHTGLVLAEDPDFVWLLPTDDTMPVTVA